MEKASARSLWRRSERGFYLPEMLLAVVVCSMTALMVARGAVMCVSSVGGVLAQAKLQAGARYLVSMLDYHLTQEAGSIRIALSQNLVVQAIHAKRQVNLNFMNEGIYCRTRTIAGIGNNPIFNTDVRVKKWQAERIGSKQLAVRFVLEADGRQQEFYHLFYCANSEVQQNG